MLLLCGILISFYDGVKGGGGGISCKNPRAVYCVATPLSTCWRCCSEDGISIKSSAKSKWFILQHPKVTPLSTRHPCNF